MQQAPLRKGAGSLARLATAAAPLPAGDPRPPSHPGPGAVFLRPRRRSAPRTAADAGSPGALLAAGPAWQSAGPLPAARRFPRTRLPARIASHIPTVKVWLLVNVVGNLCLGLDQLQCRCGAAHQHADWRQQHECRQIHTAASVRCRGRVCFKMTNTYHNNLPACKICCFSSSAWVKKHCCAESPPPVRRSGS